MVKQDRARRTHALVLDSAAEEFAAHGFSGTNLQVVAERTGLTKGALYGHFASKAELATELQRQFEAGWQELLRGAETTQLSPLTVIRTLLAELAGRTAQDMRFAAGLRLVCEEARAKGAGPAPLLQLQAVLLRLVSQAQQQGEIDTGHQPDVLGHLLLALVFGLHHTASVAAAVQGADQVQDMWQVLLPAMRGPAV